jgi:SAM-dependent methyltransferase
MMIEIRHTPQPGYDWLPDAYNAFDYGTVTQLDSLYCWFFRLLKVQRGRRLIDVACGRSQLVRLADDPGLNAVGVDFAHAPLSQLSRSGRGQYAAADGQALPFPDDHFDYVTSIGSLEHYPDMTQGVRELARILKPSGTALIYVPNTFSLLNNVYFALKTGFPLDDGQPLQRYASRGQWTELISRHGFRIVSVHKYDQERPVVWRDVAWYARHPKRLIRLMLSPFIPTNLATCLSFVVVKSTPQAEHA